MLTKERASQLLKANFETGELIWIYNYQRPDLIGKRAGHINNGYWRLSIDGVEYYAAQIIWLLYYGQLPTKTLDHEDTIKSNDAITNLRESTKGQNAANSKLSSHNTSGYKGVSYSESAKRWRADIQVNGCKKVLGYFDKPEDAHQAWVDAKVKACGAEFVRVG